MNILLIGNGFDLAHGLPTKYTDFLMFCRMILKFIEINGFEEYIPLDNEDFDIKKWINDTRGISFIDFDEVHKIFCDECPTEMSERDKNVYFWILDHCLMSTVYSKDANYQLIKEILYLTYKNFWIDHFLKNPLYQKENWIDFEREISRVIQSLDIDMGGFKERFEIDDIVPKLSNESLGERYSKYIAAVKSKKLSIVDLSKGITFKQIRNDLLQDLNKLIRAFEIYLTEYVEKIDDMKQIGGICDIIYTVDSIKPVGGTDSIIFTKVLSFNYTDTYEQLYLKNHKVDSSEIIDYIHGKADNSRIIEKIEDDIEKNVDIKKIIETNNMVLGIDEYLKKKRQNKQIEFIAFKKYYQRIHKGTGCKYKEWLDEITKENSGYKHSIDKLKLDYKKNKGLDDIGYRAKTDLKQLRKNPPKHNLYIFGHSLDVTDGDILRELILTKNMYTKIYYRNMEQKGQQIANLAKVIGPDELIRRTGGGNGKTIEFKPQQKEND